MVHIGDQTAQNKGLINASKGWAQNLTQIGPLEQKFSQIVSSLVPNYNVVPTFYIIGIHIINFIGS